MAEKEIKRVIKIESGQSANTLNNLSARIKELKDSMGDLDIASEEYREVSEDVNRLENVKRNAIRGVTAAVDGSYNAYSKELSILQKHRKTLKEGTDEYKEMTKRVAELQAKLKEMDAEVGTHTRNVGNYSSAFSGLQNSVNQVTRELPVLTMGADRFFLAISNNLPILYDNIRAYRAMAAAGQANIGILSALSKALFSWTTLITVGITLLTQFGGQIVDWISGLIGAGDAAKQSNTAVKEYTEEMKEFNQAIARGGDAVAKQITMLKKLQQQWIELGDNIQDKAQFIRDNTEAFDRLGVSIGNIQEAERLFIEQTPEYIEAIKKRAMADAARTYAETKYGEYMAAEIEYEMLAEQYPAPEHPGYSNQKALDAYGDQMEQLQAIIGPVWDRMNESFDTAERAFELAEDYNNQYKDMMAALGLTISDEETQKAREELKRIAEARRKAISKATENAGKITYSTQKGMTIPSLGADPLSAADEAASIKANEARIKAYEQMASASAEERIAIEERLNDELAMIEEIRLTEHEILLNEMLRDEELTADERIAIEQQLSEVKAEQMEAQIKAEEERAAKAKEIKDKELEEEKKRKEQMIAISTSMATATSNILKNSAERLQEDSKERKALNAAAIVMDTYAAAMAGWKSAQSLMYPFNLVVGGTNVAASIAMGAAQLKNLYKVAEDGSNAMGSLSAPSVASSMPASYTRSLQGDNELSELNRDTRVYVVESDITNAQKSARVRVESASF